MPDQIQCLRLPEKIAQAVANLETLLAGQQVERGKDILAALGTEIMLTPTVEGLEAEIRGDLRRTLALAAPKGEISWLGEGAFSRVHIASVEVRLTA